ncbi:polysaccharide deacetylase family protein [Flavobacterium hibernum]|uniref:Glycosyl transferase family 2 n=1 Tax=Flavobacterium hibernum TaxID=37752 RepID=A0A0D0F1T7_9FLAO|nr:polysaccharide deacetylase family protein [Flavobacterium hibernum]KIO53496.1 glycosyl transferase family 2 [Flavobacterium hibernum]OXA89567.1 glycosyl transferase family 2 [Flavobacterium hibernum]STO10091.1 Poly-beta-1,6-N-acetyl-D-glucosamine synthase [Flavobacterium hibernum]
MNDKKQIFQTNTQKRWKTFQWSTRLFIFAIILLIPIFIITLKKGLKPSLPLLGNNAKQEKNISNPITPVELSAKELKKYKGFDYFLRAKRNLKKINTKPAELNTDQVRAVFYVDWDPQSLFSLQRNVHKINMVIPEWFFIDPKTDLLRTEIDTAALKVMKKSRVKIVPLINNINQSIGKEGDFDGDLIHRILHDKTKRERLISDIIKNLKKYDLQGINIDFEEFKEISDEPIIAFQKELYGKLHSLGYIVSQDIMPNDDDFNIKKLSEYNDYMFLMAYDEHYSGSTPGDISSQKWIERTLDQTAKEIPSSKIILCFAGYGYDWQKGSQATTITYNEAISLAKQYGATIKFNNDSYNNSFSYLDGNKKAHSVYFTDAATNFNIIRFADEYGVAGTALWRLGSEDQRLWTFYNRSLTNESLKKKPFDFDLLKHVTTRFETPDYIGDGEILDVLTDPQPGKINLEINPVESIITEQNYEQLPTKYVISKFGNVHNQVVLTFDDGPDPTYTPQILDILKKEKVPAVFFVVGLQGESNIPLLQRIYNEGHEIGNHTFTHPNIALVSTERATSEMEATRLLIEAVTGRSTVLFRAPYNADAEPTTEAELEPVALSKIHNYYTVGESIDPNDWEIGVSADSIYSRTIKQYEADPDKGIILLHDAGGNRQATVEALPRIIKYFKDKGIQFTTVSHLLGKTKNEIMPKAKGNFLSIDNFIFDLGYWFGNFITATFWVAIILGFVRILLMAGMAFAKKWKDHKYPPVYNPIVGSHPKVSIIVPAYNEEINVVKTIENLLLQDYPDFDIVFVDDGSKDNTFKMVQDAFENNKTVKIHTKPNGGKASALNRGIELTENEYVICIDADTQLKTNAVSELMKRFRIQLKNKQEVGAVAGNVKVGNENTMLTIWQSIEYTTAQNFDRRAFDLINGITVVPGAIGGFRKEAIEKAGGFTTDTLAEDCDLTIRILRNNYHIVNCIEAVAITEAPESLKEFMKQRFRWSYGIMQAFWKNRDACFNPKYKGLGMVSLPNVLIFQIVLPIFAPLADLVLILSLIWNHNDIHSLHKIGIYYIVFMLVDMLVSVVAFIFEKEKLTKLIWLIPQRFVYRQLMYVILFKALRRAIKGESQQWGVLTRTGNVGSVK